MLRGWTRGSLKVPSNPKRSDIDGGVWGFVYDTIPKTAFLPLCIILLSITHA